mgnify:CR=1 FL=1
MPLLSSLEGWSYRLFGRIAPKFLRNIFEFKDELQKAGIKIYPETYISLMFFMALLTIPVTVTALVLLYFFKWIPLVILVPTPIFVMVAFIVTPMMRSGERSGSLEREMPFAAAYVSVMATGGISPYMSIKRLSNVETMPAMSMEAKEIIKDVEVFGLDPLSALEKAAKSNPLDTFRDFVSGYASTVITGGDVPHFLEVKTQDIFRSRSARIRVAAERLGMLLESFIIIMVLMSLCFYILFSVESIYSVGISMFSGMILYTYVFTPLLSIVFIYLAHGMQPKTPITDWRPYKAYGLCSLAAVLVLLVLNGFFGLIQVPFLDAFKGIVDLPTAVVIALVISAAPPAFISGRISRRRTGIERGIANFLRDLTEVRKTGLSPEKCVESLSKREYGEFSKELEKITSQVSWGVPLRQVFMDFVKRTKSWISQVVIFLLVEAIDVGGGTIGMIESLARFNQMTQEVEKEKKMSVRPYIIIPYFAAILLVSTTLLTLIFLAKTVSIAGMIRIDLNFISMIFTTSVIIHCYIIGLVAGKISEESIAAGFKHSAILVVVTLLASIIIPKMVTL